MVRSEDLGYAFQIPAGVPFAFFPPCSLTTASIEADSEEDALSREGILRGSLVFFAWANFVTSAELGMTLGKAHDAGYSTKWDGLERMLLWERGVNA
ncbi:hypothetical protein DMC30DRAFT_406607 [Rhodotorula diobovata]|uniref:Uncharacterized protein n=1 Tax=Rhodotorula diobovata TaxID=5288 RepID=A0A5C5FK87_9BASI|nr:hypothetical protein DMC30DRAFT_406607 [Rhodotorula diobovata]